MDNKNILSPYYKQLISSKYGKIKKIEQSKIALTNKVFTVITENNTIVIKLLSKHKDILRRKFDEIRCINFLSQKNMSPQLLDYKIPKYFIFEHIQAQEESHIKNNKLNFNEEQIIKVSETLNTFHQSSLNINKMNYEKIANIYYKKIKINHDNKPILNEIMQLLKNIFVKINSFEKHIGVVHSDLNPNNFIVDSTQKVWLIDFEYSSISDIYIDMCVIQEYLSPDNFEIFCKNYFKTNNYSYIPEKILYYRNLMDLLTILWSYSFGYNNMAYEAFLKFKKQIK